jgi:hypothetical protein
LSPSLITKYDPHGTFGAGQLDDTPHRLTLQLVSLGSSHPMVMEGLPPVGKETTQSEQRRGRVRRPPNFFHVLLVLGGAVYDEYAAQHTPSAPLKVQRLTLSLFKLMTAISQLSADTTAGTPIIIIIIIRRSAAASAPLRRSRNMLRPPEGERREVVEVEVEVEGIIFFESIFCCWGWMVGLIFVRVRDGHEDGTRARTPPP